MPPPTPNNAGDDARAQADRQQQIPRRVGHRVLNDRRRHQLEPFTRLDEAPRRIDQKRAVEHFQAADAEGVPKLPTERRADEQSGGDQHRGSDFQQSGAVVGDHGEDGDRHHQRAERGRNRLIEFEVQERQRDQHRNDHDAAADAEHAGKDACNESNDQENDSKFRHGKLPKRKGQKPDKCNKLLAGSGYRRFASLTNVSPEAAFRHVSVQQQAEPKHRAAKRFLCV